MKKEDILVINAEADDYKDAIRCAGNYLYTQGYVKDNFVEECIKREVLYPTGLPTATPIAIPHCASKFVEKESMCVLRLKDSVDFQRIDDAEQSVSTSLIFNLALKNDEEHVVFLQKFISALGSEDGDFVKDCMTMNCEEVPELFEKYNIL